MKITPSPLSAFFAFALSLILTSCSSPPAPVSSLDEAHQKFLKICKEEYQIPVSLKPLRSTLWIYLPIEHNTIEFKAAPQKAPSPAEAAEQLFLNYVDGRFEADTFYVEYDITKNRLYPNAAAMKSFYSEEYQEKQNHVLTALFRSYADLEVSQAASHKPPEFVVLVISDIKRGVESVSIFYFEDFRYAMTGFIPHEEFVLRNVMEVRGDLNALGDTRGLHLEYKEITWPEFLTKQIINRIRFKYQTSDFKPGDDDETEIITIVAQTLKSYSFSEFSGVKLRNLRTGKEYIFEKQLLETFVQ